MDFQIHNSSNVSSSTPSMSGSLSKKEPTLDPFWQFSYTLEQPSKKPYAFLVFSFLIHSTVAMALLFLNPLNMHKQNNRNDVEVEILSFNSRGSSPVQFQPVQFQQSNNIQPILAQSQTKKTIDTSVSPTVTVKKAIAPSRPTLTQKTLPTTKPLEAGLAPTIENNLDQQLETQLKNVEQLFTEESNSEVLKNEQLSLQQDIQESNASLDDQLTEQQKTLDAQTAQEQTLLNQKLESLKTNNSTSASAPAGTAGSGISSGTQGSMARSLAQLKQKPGNPKPEYTPQERKERQSGTVVFHAYINPEGVPTQFKMLQSTGHRNLDKKTLIALKQWRFYPGQEGWVEIPIVWDLKGDVKEMPTLLRVKGRNFGNL